MNILVLEASTTSAKALLYSNNAVQSVVSKPYKPLPNMSDMHSPDEILQQLYHVGKTVADRFEVDMVCISSTWHSLILCDTGMHPITKELSWQYMGASAQTAEVRADKALSKKIYDNTGCPVHASYPAYKIIAQRDLGVAVDSCVLSDLGSYIHYKLTDKHYVSECTASGSALLDIHTLNYSSFILDFVGVKPEQLPTLSPFDALSALNKTSALQLGLKDGIPVTLAFADGGLNHMASCGNSKSDMTLSVGTSTAMRMTVDTPLLSYKSGCWCYRAPVDYLVGAAMTGGCNCIDWIKHNFFSSDVSYADIETCNVDRDNLPVFLPFLYSERSPGWDDMARGGFIGLSARHSPTDMYHSVLEGVLFCVKQCYSALTAIAGEPNKVAISGGIVKSPLWLQMCADVLQRELSVDAVEQASLMGGVAVAKLIAGEKPLPLATCRIVQPTDKTYIERYQKYLSAYESR